MATEETVRYILSVIVSFLIFLVVRLIISFSGLYLVLCFVPLIVLYLLGAYFVKAHPENNKWAWIFALFAWADYLVFFVIAIIYISLAGVGAAGIGNSAIPNKILYNIMISFVLSGYLTLPISVFDTILLSINWQKIKKQAYTIFVLLILQLVGIVLSPIFL